MSEQTAVIDLKKRNRRPGPSGMAGEIVAILEERMTVGHYAAGEMLSFGKLAGEFGVSRQPVSIAVSHLRTLGYVEIVPQVGCLVASPSTVELADFFAMLGRIEGQIARLAAQRYEGREAEDLLALRLSFDPERINNHDSRLRYVQYIHEFHDCIWTMARAPLLTNQFGALRRLSSFFLWQGRSQLKPQAATLLTRQRKDIATLIAERKADAASELMERHVREKPAVVGLLDEGPVT